MPTAEAVAESVRRRFPEGVTIGVIGPRRLSARATRTVLYKLCEFLKDGMGFQHVTCVTGVDRLDHLEVVYHISSYASELLIEITVDVPTDDPVVDSITPLWGGANWHEREAYDMFGIRFNNHPRMERILLPESYEYFPFRKSFRLKER